MAKCKICGEPHKACGGPTTVAPVDLRTAENKGVEVAENKRYNVQVGGRRGAVPTVLSLSDEDAKARGLTDKDLFVAEKSKAAPKTSGSTRAKRAPAKGRTPAKNKQAAPAANKAEAPAPAPASTPAE